MEMECIVKNIGSEPLYNLDIHPDGSGYDNRQHVGTGARGGKGHRHSFHPDRGDRNLVVEATGWGPISRNLPSKASL